MVLYTLQIYNQIKSYLYETILLQSVLDIYNDLYVRNIMKL